MRGAILAGGTASRFGGRPKGLERVGGERIVDRVAAAVRAATGRPPLLVANDRDAARWRPDLEVTADRRAGCGTLGGLYTAVGAGPEPVLVVAWDMPFVTVDLLETLVAGSAGYDVFLPARDARHGIEPVCGVYGPACAEPIRQALDREDFRAVAFHEAVRVGTLSVDEVARFGDPALLFFNVNTAEDLATAEEMWRARA